VPGFNFLVRAADLTGSSMSTVEPPGKETTEIGSGPPL
jgi:hypothetical protein